MNYSKDIIFFKKNLIVKHLFKRRIIGMNIWERKFNVPYRRNGTGSAA